MKEITICPHYIRETNTCRLMDPEKKFYCFRFGIEPSIGCQIRVQTEEFNKIKEEIDDGIV